MKLHFILSTLLDLVNMGCVVQLPESDGILMENHDLLEDHDLRDDENCIPTRDCSYENALWALAKKAADLNKKAQRRFLIPKNMQFAKATEDTNSIFTDDDGKIYVNSTKAIFAIHNKEQFLYTVNKDGNFVPLRNYKE